MRLYTVARYRGYAFLDFMNYLGSADLLTIKDTVDTGFFLSTVDILHLSMSMAFRYCLVFRRFSNHSTWCALMPYITSTQVNWHGIRKALQRIIDADEKMFGGLFYPATLRNYRMLPERRWRACKGMGAADRETLPFACCCQRSHRGSVLVTTRTRVVRTGACSWSGTKQTFNRLLLVSSLTIP